MKVIYDISVLAQAHRYAKARTGIFRVVDSVARGLAASGECSLAFCVAEGVNEPVAFLADDPLLGRVPLPLAWPVRLRLRLYGNIHGLTRRIEAGAPAPASAALKGFRKTLHHAAELTRRSARVVAAAEMPRADIYHSPFAPIPAQARAASGVRKFLTVYDLIPIRRPEFCEADTTGLLTRAIDSLRPEDFALCISQATKDDLCDYRRDLDPGRVFVTRLAASELFYPCADAARLAGVRARYDIPEGAPYLLSLSTLEPRKNIDAVVRCFARLVRDGGLRDLRLVLVGARGWGYDKIFEAIDRFDISGDSIILTGYVADEDLAALYSGALAFVYLSLYEGFGLPPLEAMQCGTPVITSNNSSLPEVVGDAGRMFDPRDEDGVCQSVLDLYRDPSLRAEMSARSLVRARQFSWRRCTRETLDAYRAALGS